MRMEASQPLTATHRRESLRLASSSVVWDASHRAAARLPSLELRSIVRLLGRFEAAPCERFWTTGARAMSMSIIASAAQVPRPLPKHLIPYRVARVIH